MKKILILILILAIGLFGAVGVVSADETESGTDGVMRIHFIECGQADACLIELPDGKNMLIDAGDRGDSCAKVDEYLTATIEGERLDYVIMTHADSDHIGGITTVLSGHEIGRVYRPSQICGYSGYTDPAIAEMGKTGRPYNPSAAKSDQKKSTETYKKALEYCYTNAEEVYITDPSNPEINHIESSVTVDGETFGYTFDFYSPMGGPYDDANDYSPIMTLTYGGRNIVLSGDAEKANEAEFVSEVREGINPRYDPFRQGFDADILKLGHHGSSTSSSEEYLKIMCRSVEKRCNTYTIVSSNNAGNNYAHPHKETLQRLMDMQFSPTRIERTDLFGDIRFDILPSGGITRYRAHNYASGGNEYADDAPETLTAVLTSGASNTRDPEPIADNGVRPSDNNSSGTSDPKPNPDKPADPKPTEPSDPSDPERGPFDWFLSLPLWAQVLIIAGISLVVITIISVVAGKSRKKKGK